LQISLRRIKFSYSSRRIG